MINNKQVDFLDSPILLLLQHKRIKILQTYLYWSQKRNDHPITLTNHSCRVVQITSCRSIIQSHHQIIHLPKQNMETFRSPI